MIRTLIQVVTVALLATGCGGSKVEKQQMPSSEPAQLPPVALNPEVPRDELRGVWVADSGEVMGQKAPDKDAGRMKLEFHAEKATWHFQSPEGWKAFDGILRYDSKSEPKQVDLGQPSNPDKVALGIYKIEGNKLTISMGAERPKTFEEPSLAKMVLKRQ